MRRKTRGFVLQDDLAVLIQVVFGELCRGAECKEVGYVLVLRKSLAVSQINNKNTERGLVVPRCEWVAEAVAPGNERRYRFLYRPTIAVHAYVSRYLR